MTEKELRAAMWINHGCPRTSLYGDDGEMSCLSLPRHGLFDFRREEIHTLIHMLGELKAQEERERWEPLAKLVAAKAKGEDRG